jgi:glycosyltransferase involved in cell wall biosynthesis
MSSPEVMTRVLVFNFFCGVMDRGIPLYAQDIAECMRRIGLEPLELRCPRWLRRLPRPLLNAAFVLFEQAGAPLVRALRGCALAVYPYNSAGVIDAALGRSVIVIHDLIGNGRGNGRLAARYIRCTQAVHRGFARPVCAASAHTLAHLRRLPAFRRCALRLWPNPFYALEAALERRRTAVPRGVQARPRVLLCSGIGPNKDFAGALERFKRSQVLGGVELRIVGFGEDAYLARRRASHLPVAVRERIVVLPRLSLDELVAEYAASDLVWVHSLKEGFGRFVIEGLMSGRPVLASNIGAFRQLKGSGVYLYRRDHFEEAAARALTAGLEPRPLIAVDHAPLEAAVREVVGMHAPAIA